MPSDNQRTPDPPHTSGPAPAGEQLIQELRTRQRELELENAALRAQAAGFQRLVEQAPDLLYRFRLWPDTAFEYVSPGATALTGYTPEDHYADPALGFKLVHPDDHALLAQVTVGTQDSDEANFEMRWVRKDGSLLYTDHHLSVIRDEHGRAIALEGIARDRTAAALAQAALLERTADLRRSRDELRAANVALEKAVLLKDEFLASMSHELRTPLTGILGLSEALHLQNFGALNERQLHALENIWNSGQHLLALINDILDIAKLEAAQLELAYSQCDVRELCRAGIALVNGLAHKKRQQVAFTIDPDPISLYVDPRRLKQMLANLLGNAVKFTPATGALGLHVQGDATRQVVEFSVWDKGIGIAPENLPRLFQPFVQLTASPSSEHAGTGLGLALVYRMAQLHGGTVDVASVQGEGSTFTLTLPWRDAEPTPESAATHPHPLSPSGPSRRPAPARSSSWPKTTPSAPKPCPNTWRCMAMRSRWRAMAWRPLKRPTPWRPP